jgi:hypothetical protein
VAVAAMIAGRCPGCVTPRHIARAATGSWSPERPRAKQARWSKAIRRRAGDRCELIQGGIRCVETEGLQAHHMRPGWELEDGVLLCAVHHQLMDPKARAT